MAQLHTAHTPGYLPKWMKNLAAHKSPDMHVSSNFINNYQKFYAMVWMFMFSLTKIHILKFWCPLQWY